MENKYIDNIPTGEVFKFKELIPYKAGKISSKTIVKREDLTITMFSFGKGEGLSTHSSTGDAMVQITEGSVQITIGDDNIIKVNEGETVILPSNIPHSLHALTDFKMLLTVVKQTKGMIKDKWILANHLEALSMAQFIGYPS